ncbi:MAG: hypothetical protein WCG16_05830 [Methylococcales bacterium]
MLFIDDLKRKKFIFNEEGGDSSLFRIFLSDGSGAMLLYRVTAYFAEHNLLILAYPCQWLNKFLNGCVIGVSAKFKDGFVIMHPVGVVINSKVTAGYNITIESGVVIGDEKGHSPTLGNNIFIGSGAKVFGAITIGDNVKIGANAVVVNDIPSEQTAVGVPARCFNNKS